MQNDGCIYLVPVCIDGYFGGILECNGVCVCKVLSVQCVYVCTMCIFKVLCL